MNIEETLKDKVREQLHALKTIDTFYKQKSTDIVKNMEIVKTLKKKTPDLKPEDVRESLVEIMTASYEQTLLNNQALNFHVPLLMELKAIALVNKIDLEISKEDKEFINTLNNSSSMLYVVDKNNVVPKDADIYENLINKAKETALSEENLKGCFDHIK